MSAMRTIGEHVNKDPNREIDAMFKLAHLHNYISKLFDSKSNQVFELDERRVKKLANQGRDIDYS